MQDSKLWGPHPLVNFLDLWKSTLTLKHLLDAFGQSSGAHRSCVLGSQVQHGMLSGCNVKRGQIQVEEKKIYIYIKKKTFFTQFFAHCGETSAWPGTCANFNPTNLAPPKHHARLRCASFGWHVLQRKSYLHGQAMPQKHWSKNAKALGQKKLCWKCWGKKSLRWTRKSHIGTLLPRDVSLHDCRHIEIDA